MRQRSRLNAGARAARATLAACLIAALPFAASAETLAQALVRAYTASNLIEANRAVLRARDEGVAQAMAALRPVVSLSAGMANSVSTNPTPALPVQSSLSATLQLSAELVLFDSGDNRLAIAAADAAVLAARQTLREVEQQVLMNAVSAYLNMLRDAQFVSLEESNLRLIRQEVQAARDRFEVGEITRTDVSIAEARLAGAQSSLAARQGNLEIAREAYRLAVGSYPGQLATPPAAPRLPRTEAEASAIARAGHPSILRGQANVSAAELTVRRAEAALGPRISASASLQGREPLAGGSTSTTATVGVQMQQTLYAGGRRLSAIRQAMANGEAARAELNQAAMVVDQQLGNAWAQLAIARASIAARQEQVRAATVAFRGTAEEAALGARTTLDVLNAEQQLLDARTNLITAERDEYVAVYMVLAAMGLLTAEHLGLSVPRYDVEAYGRAVRGAPVLGGRRDASYERIMERAGRRP
ncbi:MAG: TolC family outer membrane protein [Rhodobacteraceae bacterium]|nr:TolC family outer membrane protein [Paracoccaceae bacterium]